MVTKVSLAEARALALRAQGFGDANGAGPMDVLDRLGVIQLDSVNALARSQELVPFGRLGPCSREAMTRAIYGQRRGFEYWGHVASWLPMAEYRFFLPRMEAIRTRGWRWSKEEDFRALYPLILDRIRAEGPLGASDFADERGKRGTWWDWKPAKHVLEDLFARGELMASGRGAGFERLYDLPERVLPPGLDVTNPGAAEAYRYLLRRAFAALGVANGAEAADYYRLAPGDWRPALAELVGAGTIVPVELEGEKMPFYTLPATLDRSTQLPEHRPTFLSPFDNLVWERRRVERLFGFTYRLEIYVPAPKRQYGYYVLPLLARGALLGRADLKLDRPAGKLLARSLYLEGATVEEATVALEDLATHLGANEVVVERTIEMG